MNASWTCPGCNRRFTRRNQRHACGTGESENVVRGRSASLVSLYTEVEAFAKSLGQVELVARERYVLMRGKRIFADLVVMREALRLAIHLPREATHPLFMKVVADRRHVSHVAMIRSKEELEMLKPLLREAYEFSNT